MQKQGETHEIALSFTNRTPQAANHNDYWPSVADTGVSKAFATLSIGITTKIAAESESASTQKMFPSAPHHDQTLTLSRQKFH